MGRIAVEVLDPTPLHLLKPLASHNWGALGLIKVDINIRSIGAFFPLNPPGM